MRHVDGIYTQRFNRRHGRDGPLFRGRYRAILVDADPQSKQRQPVPFQLDIVFADGRTHREGRAHGIVALPRIGLQRAEIGDDAVAQEVGDMTAVLVDGIAHALEVAVEDAGQYGWLARSEEVRSIKDAHTNDEVQIVSESPPIH